MIRFSGLVIVPFAVALLVSGAAAAGAENPVTGNSVSMYSDVRASKIGDVISVIISESNSASKNAKTTTKKANASSVDGAATTGALDGLFPGATGSATLSNDYSGQGATSRTGQLTSRMTVRVIDILPNNDLVVEGSKTMEINEDREVMTLSGIVRPSDITSTNTIYSYQIGNAMFTYKGTGALSQAERPGILTRIINWLL